MSLPREIWDFILPLACVDGGPTACALRATCRFLREATKPHRFRIVYVSGFWRIQALAGILKALEPGERLVKHLFIHHEGAPRRSERQYMDERGAKARQQYHGEGLERVIVRLYSICTRTLVTLSIAVWSFPGLNYGSYADGSFPRLRVLMLPGTNAPTTVGWSREYMPALEAVYISDRTYGSLPRAFRVRETRLKSSGAERVDLQGPDCAGQNGPVLYSWPAELPPNPWDGGGQDVLQGLVRLELNSRSQNGTHPQTDEAIRLTCEIWKQRWLALAGVGEYGLA